MGCHHPVPFPHCSPKWYICLQCKIEGHLLSDWNRTEYATSFLVLEIEKLIFKYICIYQSLAE